MDILLLMDIIITHELLRSNETGEAKGGESPSVMTYAHSASSCCPYQPEQLAPEWTRLLPSTALRVKVKHQRVKQSVMTYAHHAHSIRGGWVGGEGGVTCMGSNVPLIMHTSCMHSLMHASHAFARAHAPAGIRILTFSCFSRFSLYNSAKYSRYYYAAMYNVHVHMCLMVLCCVQCV